MSLLAIGLGLAITSTPAAAPVDVVAARANWASFERLPAVRTALPTSEMVGRVENVLSRRICQLPGQSPRRFDVTIPYAVQFDGSSLRRVIVGDIGCPAIEALTGEVVMLLAQAGEIRATGLASNRWYTSNLNFNLE